MDIPGHLDRTRYGLVEIFGRGQLDGWYPGSALGYQAFLLYGPGLTMAVAAVRLATGGALSDVGALKCLIVAGFVALPPAMAFLGRSLGLSRTAAWSAALLALAVSSGAAGGLSAVVVTGLVTQHLAIPLVLVVLALSVRAGTRPGWSPVVLLGTAVAALGLLHTISLLFVALLTPFALVIAGTHGRLHGVRPARWLAAGALAAGLGAYWWLPLATHHDLRGPVTAFESLSLTEDLAEVFQGGRGLTAPLGALVAVSLAGVTFVGIVDRRQRWALLSLAASPVAMFLIAHGVQGASAPGSFLELQIATRGVGYYCYFALFPVGVLFDALGRRLPGRVQAWSWVPSAAIAAVALVGLAPMAQRVRDPVPAMGTVADRLRSDVPPGGRFVLHEMPEDDFLLRVVSPARWLSWASGRPGLAPFGPEYAPGAAVAAIGGDPLTPRTVDDWVERARALAVTHIVTASRSGADALAGSASVELVQREGILAVFAIVPSLDRPVGSILDAAGARVVAAGPDHYEIAYDQFEGETVTLALGWSPKWSATIDGRPVPLGRTDDDRAAIDLPAGSHVVDLRFGPDATDALGRAISGGTVLALLVAGTAHLRRQRQREECRPVRR